LLCQCRPPYRCLLAEGTVDEKLQSTREAKGFYSLTSLLKFRGLITITGQRDLSVVVSRIIIMTDWPN